MIHGRKRLATGLSGVAALIAVSLVPAAPSNADPDIDDVKTKVDKLYHQAEQAQESYHDAKLKLKELRAELKDLKADEKAQQQKVDSLEGSVNQAIAAQYEGQTISATGELVLSDNPEEFLSELSTISAYNDVQSQVLDQYDKEHTALEIRQEATEERAEELAETEKALGENKAKVDEKLADAKELLAELEAEERAEFEASVSRGAPARLPDSVPVSGRAKVAVNYALSQVGKSYVYGAAGPSAFDCSGLTMRAWGAAGVGLPHSSGAQKGSGTPVSSSSLRPGDLVFYYSPISHVGIYIGGGKIVHAANPGTGVVVSGVFSMPYSGAVRPG